MASRLIHWSNAVLFGVTIATLLGIDLGVSLQHRYGGALESDRVSYERGSAQERMMREFRVKGYGIVNFPTQVFFVRGQVGVVYNRVGNHLEYDRVTAIVDDLRVLLRLRGECRQYARLS